MSDLGFNKIAGAVLATALAIVGLEELSAIVYKSEPAQKPGYAITVAAEDTGGAPEAPDVPPDWGTVLPTADVTAGTAVSQKCMACHNLQKGGPNLVGPNLYGVLGRKPGSHPGYAYSTVMTDFGGKTPQWDYDHLYDFLKSPQSYLSGSKMTFVGLKKPEDRINLIAYLRTLNDSPPAIPAPKPKAAAPAAPAAGAPAAAAAPGVTTPPASAAKAAAAAPQNANPAAPATPAVKAPAT
jgi:cytochrome c